MKRLAAAVCLFVACAWGEGTGQYSAMLEQDPGLPTHTIYRPQDRFAWVPGDCHRATGAAGRSGRSSGPRRETRWPGSSRAGDEIVTADRRN